jgi:hypothetical protein
MVAVALPAVAVLDLALPGRPVLALAFVLLVPGVPVAALLRVPEPLLAGSLAGAISLATALLGATIQVMTGWWHPVGWAASVAVLSLGVTGWVMTQQRRWPPPTGMTVRSGTGRVWTTPRDRVVSVVALVVALALWWLATRWADLDAASALGVVGVVGWPYLGAVGLVAAVAAYQLRRPSLDIPVLAAAAVVLTLVLYGFVNVADGEASVGTAWVHVGFIRFITEQHATFAGVDARAHWPGFFAAAAQLVELAGVPDATAFLRLAPTFYNVAAIAPLLVIGHSVTGSRRMAWLGVFVYLSVNWVQQDYFSPQATAFLLYLVALALLLWMETVGRMTPLAGPGKLWFRPSWSGIPALPPTVSPLRSLAWEGALAFLAAAMVVTHQLTPVTLAITLLVFAVTGSTRYRRLWLIVVLLVVTWFSYAATDFWIGHLRGVLGDFGQVDSNFGTAVSSRVEGQPTYQLMQNLRILWSVLFGLVALIGWWTIRRRRQAFLLALLTAGAGALLVLGSYGGEVVLRSFVFAAPLLAPLAALGLRGLVRRRGLVSGVGLPATLAVAAMLLTATRGVNVAFERVTSDELAAAQAMFGRMTRGDSVGYLEPTGALGYERIGEWRPVVMQDPPCVSVLECAVDLRPDFIIVSRSTDAWGHLQSGLPEGWTATIADSLVARGLYEVIYRGHDGEALQAVSTKG